MTTVQSRDISQGMDFSAVVNLVPGTVPPPVEKVAESAQVNNLPAVLTMLAPRAVLEPFRSKAKDLAAKASTIKVQDQETQLAATTLAGTIKKVAKTVEDARKEYTAPINEHVKAVNGLAKEITTPLDTGMRHLTGQLNQYAAKVELDRRKAEEEARRQAEAEQKRLDAEAKAAGVEAPIVPEVLPAKSEKATVRTETGTSYQRKVWTFEVEKLDDVPREYMFLNEKAVNAAIRNGVRSIPGLKILETTSTVIR
ncbi:hypothetical protein [uncultured Desulfovibrio sp.]|uniref:hypothetical protein n=1 Tax=uncultured Desulfovibrio sp. TaxID=167968 RepID=UPI0028690C2C|nr:hypothetical protein [uncultured Desulfovibrio sp.]